MNKTIGGIKPSQRDTDYFDVMRSSDILYKYRYWRQEMYPGQVYPLARVASLIIPPANGPTEGPGSRLYKWEFDRYYALARTAIREYKRDRGETAVEISRDTADQVMQRVSITIMEVVGAVQGSGAQVPEERLDEAIAIMENISEQMCNYQPMSAPMPKQRRSNIAVVRM